MLQKAGYALRGANMLIPGVQSAPTQSSAAIEVATGFALLKIQDCRRSSRTRKLADVPKTKFVRSSGSWTSSFVSAGKPAGAHVGLPFAGLSAAADPDVRLSFATRCEAYVASSRVQHAAGRMRRRVRGLSPRLPHVCVRTVRIEELDRTAAICRKPFTSVVVML